MKTARLCGRAVVLKQKLTTAVPGGARYWNSFVELMIVWITPSVSGMPTHAQASASCQAGVPP
jgi:hypothetical protein